MQRSRPRLPPRPCRSYLRPVAIRSWTGWSPASTGPAYTRAEPFSLTPASFLSGWFAVAGSPGGTVGSRVVLFVTCRNAMTFINVDPELVQQRPGCHDV